MATCPGMATWRGSHGWILTQHWRGKCTSCAHQSVLMHTCVCAQVNAPRCPHCTAPADTHQSVFHAGSWAPTPPLPKHWTLDHGRGFLPVTAGQRDKHCGHGSTGKGQEKARMIWHTTPTVCVPPPSRRNSCCLKNPQLHSRGQSWHQDSSHCIPPVPGLAPNWSRVRSSGKAKGAPLQCVEVSTLLALCLSFPTAAAGKIIPTYHVCRELEGRACKCLRSGFGSCDRARQKCEGHYYWWD